MKGECFESALEFGGGVVAVCFCFGGGGRGPVSFRAVKGKGGQSALELCSAGNGGESACVLWGMEASQLWSCVLRGMEASQLPGL